MIFYSRTLYSTLFQHLNKKQITVLTGVRRTGKTTLVKQLMQECLLQMGIFRFGN